VAIGLLATIILVVINLLGENKWDFQQVVAVVAPFLSSLGIRQAVMPMAKLDDATRPDA
jgi:hypothetical protein